MLFRNVGIMQVLGYVPLYSSYIILKVKGIYIQS